MTERAIDQMTVPELAEEAIRRVKAGDSDGAIPFMRRLNALVPDTPAIEAERKALADPAHFYKATIAPALDGTAFDPAIRWARAVFRRRARRLRRRVGTA